jgi:isocitrate dehydrogenase
LKTYFTPIAAELTANEAKIDTELIEAQGKKQEIGGYYQPNESFLIAAMRPSTTLNAIINKM